MSSSSTRIHGPHLTLVRPYSNIHAVSELSEIVRTCVQTPASVGVPC